MKRNKNIKGEPREEKSIELISRWNDDGGRKTAVQDMLNGKMSDDLIGLLGLVNGRIDLRGFTFHSENDTGKTTGTRSSGVRYDSVDFSMSDLHMSHWEDCHFSNCLFNSSTLWQVGFAGCTIESCTFSKSKIVIAGLGRSSKKNLGAILNTSFNDGRFSDVYFGYPRIEGCVFNCNVVNTDFHGSQFKDTRFTRKLSKVEFHGQAPPSKEEIGTIDLENVQANRMENLDFSEADMADVTFDHWTDLSRCSFPKNIVYIKNGPEVLRRALEIIDREWTGLQKVTAKAILEVELGTLEYRETQHQVAINVESAVKIYARKRPNEFSTGKLVELLTSLRC